MKVAIYSQKSDAETSIYLNNFVETLQKKNIEVVIYQKLVEKISFKNNVKTFAKKDDLEKENIQYFFSFGGDGTILNALIFIQELQIPIIGVNTGRLGFLTSFSKTDIYDHLNSILNGELQNSERTVIKVSNTSKNIDFPYALNDVSITRKETTSMVTIESYINNEFLNVFWGDGLLISTPTGSTAYSLACGGPIITPKNKNFCITPIAPHNLNVRPLLLDDDVKINLKVQSRAPEYILALDSRLYIMDVEEELFIEKSEFIVKLVQSKNNSFFETIRQKLLWGNDKRN